jgi:hypothetical protein
MSNITLPREDIIRWAREAEDYVDTIYQKGEYHPGWLEVFNVRFAALVAEAEREACAEVCEKQMKSYMSKQYTVDPLGGFRERFAAEQCAAAIRARGE